MPTAFGFTQDLKKFPFFALWFTLALLLAAPAGAQVEIQGTASIEGLNLAAPTLDETKAAMLWGVQIGYRVEPWFFSGEFVTGRSIPPSELERNRGEITAAYALTDSLSLAGGARVDTIQLYDVAYFFFFFIPVAVPEEEGDVELMNAFVGLDYETDRDRRNGFLASARWYEGFAEVSTAGGPAQSDRSRGYRVELAGRIGRPEAAIIVGAAYESFNLSDAGVDITSRPAVFIRYRLRTP